jgi:hypothetical protein
VYICLQASLFIYFNAKNLSLSSQDPAYVALRVVVTYANLIQMVALITVTAMTEKATIAASKWVSRVVCCQNQQKTTKKKSSLVNEDPECSESLHTDPDLIEATLLA